MGTLYLRTKDSARDKCITETNDRSAQVWYHNTNKNRCGASPLKEVAQHYVIYKVTHYRQSQMLTFQLRRMKTQRNYFLKAESNYTMKDLGAQKLQLLPQASVWSFSLRVLVKDLLEYTKLPQSQASLASSCHCLLPHRFLSTYLIFYLCSIRNVTSQNHNQ